MATTPVNFFKEVRDELKKVVWPSREEVIRLTSVVIIVSVGIGLFLGGIDLLLTKVVQLIVTR